MNREPSQLIQLFYCTHRCVVRSSLECCLRNVPQHRARLLGSDRVLLSQLILFQSDRSRHMHLSFPIQHLAGRCRRESKPRSSSRLRLTTQPFRVMPHKGRLHFSQIQLRVCLKLNRHIRQLGLVFFRSPSSSSLCHFFLNQACR